jgi:hypothetical protein
LINKVSFKMRWKFAASLLLGFCFCTAFCQLEPPRPPSEAGIGPVEAELLKPLNVRSLTVGGTVFVRVTRDWNGLGCSLRQGATLEATVQQAETVTRHHGKSSVALAFTKGQCNGTEMKPLNLLLSAVAHVPENWGSTPTGNMSVPLSFGNPVSLGGRGSNSGPVSYARERSNNTPLDTWHVELKGITHHFPMTAKIQPGDVIDLKGMKLDLGTGPSQSSVLSLKGSDVRLDQYTQFLLVPSSLVFERTTVPMELPAGLVAGNKLSNANQPALSAGKDIEVCAPPGCAVDLPVTSEQLQGTSEISIETRPLGYTPRPAMVLSDFNQDEALAWLGPQQVLFAFNVHGLIPRGSITNWKSVRRNIRAILLDTQSRNIIRAVDWEVADSKRFLWPLSGNHVLVHVGNELRLIGAGLEVERTIPLAGPLEFICMSPNREVMAVATLRERHSPELHSRLREELMAEPEEDVDVAILDRDFKTLAQTSAVSGIEPPTLLNEGQVTILAQPKMFYRLRFSSWEGPTSTLARFTSLCKPELSSVAPDLLFLVTCDTVADRYEYRVLRPDGRLLLQGRGNEFEMGEEMVGAEGIGLFAIKAVHAGDQIIPGKEFKASDLSFQELRVYRAADGKRLLAVHVKEPTVSRGTYAISGDGSQLAVLSLSQIQLLDLPEIGK